MVSYKPPVQTVWPEGGAMRIRSFFEPLQALLHMDRGWFVAGFIGAGYTA